MESPRFDAMRIIDQAIQNAVEKGEIPDLFVPSCYRRARSQNDTPSLAEIPAKLNSVLEGSRTPIQPGSEHHRSEATLAF
jgi:hypothetical protein